MRADARRSYEQILVAAEAAIALHGADVSLEQIARQAGVGSATLHRHFPSRWVLLEAVFRSHVEALCAQAHALADAADPGRALVVWLHALAAQVTANRGLAASMLRERQGGEVTRDDTCHDLILRAGDSLLRRAREVGAVRPEVAITDLLALVNAISLAAEQASGDTALSERLLGFVTDGIRPRVTSSDPSL